MSNILKASIPVILTFNLAAGATLAAEVKVMAPNLPPMIMENGEGREAEIIKATMERCGHTVAFEVQPFTRHWASYEAGEGDAVTTVPVGMPLPGATTVPYIMYQNGVSYLSAREESIQSLGDLASQNVVSFRGATAILPALADASSSFGKYSEVTDQIVHSRLLFSGRADAVVGDGMIFAEYNQQLAASSDDLGFDAAQGTVFNATFEPSSYGMNFRDAEIAADFDRCFGEATADGTIDAINVKWVDRYRTVLGDQYMGH
jgi:ABC-type amino acid transport substrate-binding protein